MEIYFHDLTLAAQEKLLKEFDLKYPKDMNWDIFPLATIETGDEQEPMITYEIFPDLCADAEYTLMKIRGRMGWEATISDDGMSMFINCPEADMDMMDFICGDLM